MHYYRLRNTGTTDAAPPKEQATCSVDGCPSVVKARSLCNRHYQQVQNSGAVQPDDDRTPEQRFFERVDRSGGPDACHPWTGPVNEDGYGVVKLNGRSQGAHVAAWTYTHGPVPDGHNLDHTCHDPKVCRLGKKCPHRRCCNAERHIAAVTPAQNGSAERSAQRDVVGLLNASKIQCVAGHYYNESNTYITPKGERHCRACNRDKAWKYRNGDIPRPQTELDALALLPPGVPDTAARCGRGHLWTEANTYLAKGYKRCRQCDRELAVRRRRLNGDVPKRRKPRTTPVDYVRGEQVHTAKLTAEQVNEIRRRYAAGGITQKALGIEYGLSQASVSVLVRGKSWALTT